MQTRPALKAACLLAAGILLAEKIRVGTACLLGCACAVTALASAVFLSIRNPRVRIGQGLVLAAFILAGGLRYSQESRSVPSGHVVRFINPSDPVRRILLKGTLVRDPANKPNRTEILIEADSAGVRFPLSAAHGKVLAPLYGKNVRGLRYGDKILTTGILTSPAGARNPGGFDYREWLSGQGIRAVLRCGPMDRLLIIGHDGGNVFFRKCVYPVRRFALAFMDSTVRDPDSRSLLAALTLGDQGMISPEVREDFSRTGAVHILSVSGSHVGFMYLILSVLFGFLRLPAAFNAAATAAGLGYYALLTESSAPVVRATVMAVALLAGSRLERKTDPYNTLGFAGLFILAWKPQHLFDVGFQLSFLSVFSILYLYGKLKTLLSKSAVFQKAAGSYWTKGLVSAVTVSLAAQVGTAPLTAFYFNWIPLVSVPANLIAVPLSGLIMAVSFTSLIIAPLHFWTASVYGTLDSRLLAVFIRALDGIEKIPFSCLTVPSPSGAEMAVWYGTILLILNLRSGKTVRTALFVILISADLAVWTRVLQNRPGRLRWIQFDVGQGDAALFIMPRGGTLLVDAGPRTGGFDCGQKTIAPFLNRNGIRRLDALVLTHPHDDHSGGAEYLIRHFKIGEIVVPGGPDTSGTFARIFDFARMKHIPVRPVRTFDSLSVFEGAKVVVCNPLGDSRNARTGGSNERSLVVLMEYGVTRWMSTGDADTASEALLAKSLQWDRCDALKIGHHGSRSSTSLGFLQKVRPALAVVSVGENNRFGHPDGEVIERLSLVCGRVHRTDTERAVILESDGKRTRIIKWR